MSMVDKAKKIVELSSGLSKDRRGAIINKLKEIASYAKSAPSAADSALNDLLVKVKRVVEKPERDLRRREAEERRRLAEAKRLRWEAIQDRKPQEMTKPAVFANGKTARDRLTGATARHAANKAARAEANRVNCKGGKK